MRRIPSVCRITETVGTEASGILCGFNETRTQKKESQTNLNFLPCSVNPFGIIGHSVDISKGFESHFYIAGNVQDPIGSIHDVGNGLLWIII
jgi:hypothetical protein